MHDSTDAHHRELLPWYAAGTLNAAEREIVAHHLATCAACQHELAQWQALGAATQSTLQNVIPTTTTDVSWQRLQLSLSSEQTSNGKHTTTRGERYMEFENQTFPTVATATRHAPRRPTLALAAVVLVVMLSIVGFVFFAAHTQHNTNVGVKHQPGPTSTLSPSEYPTNASLVTPNPDVHTPISSVETSAVANNVNGKLNVPAQTALFHVGDTVNVSSKVQGAKANDIISVKWYMNNTDLTPSLIQAHTDCCSKTMIDDKTTDVIFGLQAPSPGFGKAEIYYNDTLAYTVLFELVTSAQLTPTTGTPSH